MPNPSRLPRTEQLMLAAAALRGAIAGATRALLAWYLDHHGL